MGLGGAGWVRQEKWIIWRPGEFLISPPRATPVLSVVRCAAAVEASYPPATLGASSLRPASRLTSALVSHDVPGHQTPVINIKTWAFLSKDSKTSHSELESSNL